LIQDEISNRGEVVQVEISLSGFFDFSLLFSELLVLSFKFVDLIGLIWRYFQGSWEFGGIFSLAAGAG
jgi:hypothetical protein